MKWPTYYLRTDTEQQFIDALTAAGLVDEEGFIQANSHDHALHIIGAITRQTGELDENEEPIMETLPGWHANWRGELPEPLQPIAIPEPSTPFRVWA